MGTRAGRPNISDAQKEQIWCLRGEKKQMHVIAKIMGLSIGAVWHTINNRAIIVKPVRPLRITPNVTDPTLLKKLTAGR